MISGNLVAFGGYVWLVLSRQGDCALLLAKDAVETRMFDPLAAGTGSTVSWENCEVRGWLNHDFYNRFSTKDKRRIVAAHNHNPGNPLYHTNGCPNTIDNVFLLSLEEAVLFFGNSGALENLRAKQLWLSDAFNVYRMARYWKREACWWLRTPGRTPDSSLYVSFEGQINLQGVPMSASGGVRPALWIR